MPLPTNLAKAHALILRQREELAAAEAKQQALVAEGYTPPMPLTSQSPVISFKSLPTMLMKTVCG